MIATLPGFHHRVTARSRGFGPGLVIDNFAGAGGASLGIEAALGRAVDIAINHDKRAIETHVINHPATKHLQSDVWEVDPAETCAGRPVALAWFSPDCKHFSKAKGGKPVSKRVRGLAWVVIKWAKAVKPSVIILENVEEFQTWGPLGLDDRPCPDRKGDTFRRWKAQLKNLGYVVEHRELRACDFGVPTTRKRFFLVARCDGLPIVWPQPTHCDPKRATELELKPWRTAAECIDWELPCPSIFERKRPLADATQRRIANGLRRYVFQAKKPFIVRTGHWSHRTGEGFGFRGQGVDQPLGTVCATNEKALVTPLVVNVANSKTTGRGPNAWDAEQPVRTITSRNGFGIVTPVIVGCGGRAGQSRPRSADEPSATITSKADACLVTPFIVGAGGPAYSGKPVALDEPARTLTAENHRAVVAPVIVKQNFGAKPCSGAEEPLHTLTTQTNRHNLVSAFLAKHYGGVVGHEVTRPIGTVTSVDHHSLVTGHLTQLRGTNQGKGCVEEPMPTLTAGGTHVGVVQEFLTLDDYDQIADRHAAWVADGCPPSEPGNHVAEVRAFLIAYFGNERDGQSVESPIRTLTSKHRFGVVEIEGVDYQVIDIGMRMLVPRELLRAQFGRFADDYVLTGTQAQQVAGIGNSVCPELAEALVRANVKLTSTALHRRRAAVGGAA